MPAWAGWVDGDGRWDCELRSIWPVVRAPIDVDGPTVGSNDGSAYQMRDRGSKYEREVGVDARRARTMSTARSGLSPSSGCRARSFTSTALMAARPVSDDGIPSSSVDLLAPRRSLLQKKIRNDILCLTGFSGARPHLGAEPSGLVTTGAHARTASCKASSTGFSRSGAVRSAPGAFHGPEISHVTSCACRAHRTMQSSLIWRPKTP